MSAAVQRKQTERCYDKLINSKIFSKFRIVNFGIKFEIFEFGKIEFESFEFETFEFGTIKFESLEFESFEFENLNSIFKLFKRFGGIFCYPQIFSTGFFYWFLRRIS